MTVWRQSMFTLLCVTALTAYISQVHAASATLAVASNFKATAQELKKAFEQQSDHHLRIVSASSGKLYAQIVNNAPFDIFLSADQHKPEQLQQQGMIVKDKRMTYAMGQLLLWSANKELAVKPCIVQGCFTTLAMANPRHAPYGQAAMQVMQSLKLEKTQQQRYIVGENINQSLQFIHSGNAELVFIAASQLTTLQQKTALQQEKEPTAINIWFIPAELYTPIKQDAVWLKRAADNAGAKAFWQFLQSEAATDIIEANAYHVE